MRAKKKSLRQLAKKPGVSHYYLSQVKNCKFPASAKVVSKSGQRGKHKIVVNPSKCYNSQV